MQQLLKLKNDEAYYYFKKSREQQTSTKVLKIACLLSITGGIGMTLAASPIALFSKDAANKAGTGMIIAIAGIAAGIQSYKVKSQSISNYEKSMYIFNTSQNKEVGFHDEYELELGVASNGVGIQYSF